MTSSRNFDRLLQVTCLGLVGMLTAAGCGGSSNNPPDAKVMPSPDVGVVQTPDAPVGGLSVDQGILNFGSVDQGAPMVMKTVTVKNSGPAVAVMPTITVGDDFSIQGGTCTTLATVPTNGTCTIIVGFSAPTTGATSATGVLTVAPGITVSLSATITVPGTFSASLSPLPATALVGQAVPVTVNVVVAGGALTDLSCLPNGADVAVDPVAANTTCLASQGGGTSCVYGFVFKGVKAGPANDSIKCNAAGKLQVLSVSLTVLSPASLSIAPTPANFAAVVGTTSDPITLRIRNNGTAATGALTVALGGTGAAQFAISDNECGATIAGSDSCTVTVVFKPAAAGNVTATLTATDATVGSIPAIATLAGTATAASSLAITGTADFGNVTVGKGAVLTYTLTNGGGTTSDLLKVAAADAQFVVGNDTCTGLALAAAGTCTFTVTFSPASAGAKFAVVTVSSATALLAQKQLTGTGVAAPIPAMLTMSPPTLDFGTIGVRTTAGPKSFTVTNSGGTASAVLSVVKNDSTSSVGGASQFTYTTTCSAALAPAATCFVSVTFAPTISRSASAVITVTDGTASTPAGSGTVVGIALDRPSVSIDCGEGTTSWRTGKSELFDDQVVGKTSTLACSVKNDPNSPQETGAITLAVTGDFAVPAATNNCGPTLVPGLSCTFALTFTPTAMGERDGTLTLTTANQGASNMQINGVGLGVVEIVEYGPCAGSTDHVANTCDPNALIPSAGNVVTAEPFDFGQATVGTTSSTVLTLAVYVRASVGNLSVTKAFGAPDAFALADGSDLGMDCDTYAGTPTPTSGFLLETPLCFKLVDFTPVARTTANGTVTVSGANAQSDSATMTGLGTGPLTISPSPATFSNVAVNTSSPTLILTVKNSGPVSIDAMSYVKAGANADQFSIVLDSLTGQSIPGAGNFVTIGVRFIPTAVGAAAATLTVSGTVHGNSSIETQTVNLIGNGATGPAMTATIANNGVFATTPAGNRSAALTVTVSNAAGSQPTGNVSFSVVPTSDFTLAPIDSSVLQVIWSLAAYNPVPGGSTCTYLVWFTPNVGSALVARSETLKVTDALSGKVVLLPLSGNADPQISISPAGTAATPVDMGTTVVNSSTPTATTFTVTNNSLVNIPAAGLTISTVNSADGPNLPSLFGIDNSASNNCNGIVAKSGGTCVFTLDASSTDMTTLGAFFGQVQVTVVTPGAQVAKSDVKTTVVQPAVLALAPSTDFWNLADDHGTDKIARDLGTVVLNIASAPAKYTLVNTGGVNSSAITAILRDHGLNTGPTKTKAFVLDATACTGLGEAGLAPGGKCDLLVTFHPASDDTGGSDSTVQLGVDLVVTATNGASTEIRRWIQGTASTAQNDSYLVDDTTGLAPADLGVLTGAAGATVTRTIAIHAGTTGLALPANLAGVAISGVGMGGGAGETIALSDGPAGNAPCSTVWGTTLAASAKCTLTVTWTLVTAQQSEGWRVFTVDLAGTPTIAMNLLGRVGAQASLLVSRSNLDFGYVLANGSTESQHETVVVTNTGELTTTGNVIATLSNTTAGVATSGCGSTLPYLGTCTMTIWVVPQAAGPSTSLLTAPTVTATATGAAPSGAVALTWFGTTVASLSLSSADGNSHTFANQPVLSTTANTFQFTITNGINAEKSGVLGLSVVDSTGAVVPDFSLVPGGGSTCLTQGLLGAGNGTTGKFCTLTIQFTPISLAPATKTGTLTVVASPGTTATPPTATLTGKAIAALSVTGPAGFTTAADGTNSFAVAPTSVAPATGTAVTVAFKNDINAPMTGILTTVVSGTNAGDFLVTRDGCTGQQIATVGLVAGTCSVDLVFKPTVVGDGKTATVTVSGSPGDSAALTLTGNAIN